MSDPGESESEAVVADRAARQRAQREFGTPLVLEAGAGTGKTAVLVARVVAWCLGPGWQRNAERRPDEPPDRIAGETLRRVVAITFTEAAAAEMETRVRTALTQIEAGEALPVGVDAAALPADVAMRAERARLLLGCLDQLGVRTIHAWCRRLLAAQPLEVGLHPRFQVDADGRRQAEVVREVLELALVEAYSGEGLDDHRALVIEGVGPTQIEETLAYLVGEGIRAEDLGIERFDAAALDALRGRLLAACQSLADAGAERLVATPGSRAVVATAESLAQARKVLAGPIADYASLAAVFAGWEKSQRNSLASWAKGGLGVKAQEVLGGVPDGFAAAARSLKAGIEHLERLDREGLARARQVLGPILAEANRELRKRGVQSFDALLRDASRLVAGPAGVRVRGEIDQLLVDEFQDTDGTQCEILRRLVLRAPQAERPGLFLVGDPKQSIYGWRRADLAAWYDFVSEVESSGGELHSLVVNFRSVPAVLAEVERIVAPVMHPKLRVQPGFQRLEASPDRRSAAAFAQGGRCAVEHWVCDGWDADAGRPVERTRTRDATDLEARAIAADIAALNRDHQVPWDECALLLRSLGDLDIYLGAFRDAGVPYVVERDQSYYRRREIIEAQALVRSVLDPLDAVALVALLRSAWVGVPDAALLPLWHAQLPDTLAGLGSLDAEARRRLRELVESAAARVPAGVPGLERVEGWAESLVGALEAVVALRASFAAEPADRFVEKLRGALACEVSESARYLGHFRLANHDRFFRDLVTALDETGGDVPAVLSYLRRAVSDRREAEEGRPRDADNEAVHVTTIHKAKGLGFGHVYLAQVQKLEPSGPGPGPRVVQDAASLEYRLFGKPTPGFDRSGEDERVVRDAERVRLLYVALTRAKDRLVICGSRGAGCQGDPAAARNLGDLVSDRDAGQTQASLMEALAAAGEWARQDAHAARWYFPALSPALAQPPAAGAASAFDVAAARRAAEALGRARAEAQRHEARPFSAAASRKDQASEEQREAASPGALARELAMRVGTAVHSALEHLDAGATAAVQRSAGRDAIERALAAGPAGEAQQQARARAAEVFDAFLVGPLGERFREIAPAILARELPVLLAPRDDSGPVGFVSGNIDLLYREGKRWVVADYKTGKRSDAAIESYRDQGAVYTEAVRGALDLDETPHFELWFLEDGEIVPLPAAS